jgi:glycosidase
MKPTCSTNPAFLLLLLCVATLWAATAPAHAQGKKPKPKTAAQGKPRTKTKRPQTMNDPNLLQEPQADHKLIVYQMMTRLFGNPNPTNQVYGSLEQNGVGKLNDVNATALAELRRLGITHVWYTGVIEHATMTDFSAHGIPPDDADVVKGRAGSAYAIKDYYDISPELAVDVPNRVREFEALVQRTHQAGLKAIIDFVPNHVARRYRSDAKPPGVQDLGETDNPNVAFGPNNNFYYLPGTRFQVPREYQLPDWLRIPTKDGQFDEAPAKATGNDQFTATPSVNDWFETVKLNYGVDYQNNRQKHFDPIPNTWLKMRDILRYWAGKGVDGFRCDMAEMVPVEFWAWAIPEVKKSFPEVLFIAEIYNPNEYRNYIDTGKFDYLYDKVGLYDTLKAVVQGRAGAGAIGPNWRQLQGLNYRMLRFLENHDEQRLASPHFAGRAEKGLPLMVVTATLGTGPVMLYFGQEVGEPGAGVQGFSGEDGRTSMFDYSGVPEHQKWLNGGKFDGGQLSPAQRELRSFYAKLLNLCTQHPALARGGLYDLHEANAGGRSQGYDDQRLYAYLRFTDGEKLLVIVNFDEHQAKHFRLKVPEAAFDAVGLPSYKKYRLTDLLGGQPSVDFLASEAAKTHAQEAGIGLHLPPLGTAIYRIEVR